MFCSLDSIISTCIPLIFFILYKINEIYFYFYLCDLFEENPKDIQISELKTEKDFDNFIS